MRGTSDPAIGTPLTSVIVAISVRFALVVALVNELTDDGEESKEKSFPRRPDVTV